VDFGQPKDFPIKQSSSAKPLTQLAATKGYSLAATTFCKLNFVKNEFKAFVIGADDLALEELRDDADCKTYIFMGFDGTVLTNKSTIGMPWHNIELDLNSLQQLPGFLRRHLLITIQFKKYYF
jgi:hypothetical protein